MAQKYTRKLIRDTFVSMLNEQPLTKITVKDLVTACEINRNTFYYYYADIYEIISEIFETELQKVIDEYNDTLSWEDSFLMATSFALENKKAIYHVYNSMQREELEHYIFEVSGNVMTRYIDKIDQDFHASARDKKIIVFFYQSALTEMVLHWIAGGMKEDPEEVIRRVGKLFDGNVALSLERSAKLGDRW